MYKVWGVDSEGNLFSRNMSVEEFNKVGAKQWNATKNFNEQPAPLRHQMTVERNAAKKLAEEANAKRRAAERAASASRYEAERQQQAALKETAEKVLENLNEKTAQLDKLNTHKGLLTDQVEEAMAAIQKAGGNKEADRLYAQFNQWAKEFDQALTDVKAVESDALGARIRPEKYVSTINSTDLTSRGATAYSQATKAIDSADDIEQIVSKLRNIATRIQM